MKLLKKFLLIGLCSFAFCVSTNADVILPELPFDKENTSYVVEYDQDRQYVYVGYCNGSNYSLGSASTYSSIGSSTVHGFSYCINENGGISSMYKKRIDTPEINSDVYNDIVDLSSYSWITDTSGNIMLSYFPELERLQILSDGPIGKYYWYNNPIIEANMDVYLRSSSDNFAFKVFDHSILDSPAEENICDRTAVLGAVSNVNEIKLNVKGETSALAEPLKGTFTLNYTSVIVLSEDNFSVEFVNNSDVNVVGNYTFKCATDSYNCYLNYEYNTEDDITETVDFSFKIRSVDNGIMPLIKIYSCTTNDDYTYISYDYTNGPSDSTTSNPSLDNILQNGDISGSQDTANGFFNNFTDNDYGLSSIITIPLSSIQKITNATCNPINLPVPFTNSFISLPCMYDLYEDNVPSLLNIWQIVSFGLISYAIIVDIFSLVKKFKDPNDDKLEVMDL